LQASSEVLHRLDACFQLGYCQKSRQERGATLAPELFKNLSETYRERELPEILDLLLVHLCLLGVASFFKSAPITFPCGPAFMAFNVRFFTGTTSTTGILLK
jgi:hypothetical protein